ncbi:PD40 domain-containing protein [Candidatus Pacearchaeota archaeon]|nr:PD40 domain-containing protein [Candidatus Pacearchaeota archaeon]
MELERLLGKAKKFSRTPLAAALTASYLFINACGGGKPTKPVEPPKEKIEFAESVNILDEGTMGNLSYYHGDTIIFQTPTPQVESLNKGDIIISEVPNSLAQLGFLRRVTSISDDRKTLLASQATLEDAIKEADISISKRLTPREIIGNNSLNGLAKPASSENFDFIISFNNLVVYDNDGNPNTIHDQVILNGDISFNYDFAFDLKVSDFKLKKLRFDNRITESQNLTVGAALFRVGKEIRLAEYFFAPVPIPSTPLFVIPYLELVAGISGEAYARFGTGVSQSATLRAGIIRENEEWSAPFEFKADFDYQEPTVSGDVKFKGYLGPKMSLLVYGLAGVYGDVDGFLELNAASQSPRWELSAGLEASLGVEDKIFGWIDYDINIINYKKTLAKDTTPPLVSRLTAKPDSGNAPLEVLLDASASTGGVVEYKFNFGDGNSYNEKSSLAPDGIFDGKTRHTYNVSGTYIPSVTVLNQNADQSVAKDTINVSEVGMPSGKILYYAQTSYHSWDIFTINVDGTQEKQLTSSSFPIEVLPSWSPDARKIAYSASYPPVGGRIDIYVMDADGTNRVQITATPDRQEEEPIFSADGTKILYLRSYPDPSQLYLMNVDGSNQRKVGSDVYDYWNLAWSPNGQKVAFVNSSDLSLYVTDLDGSNAKKLTNASESAGYPCFSPDGTKIVFSRFDGNSEIYVMNSDGSNQRNISNDQNTDDDMPCYSPDGRFIVYTSKQRNTGSYEIWIMKSDGTGKKRITNNSYSDLNPKWSPK